MLRLVHMIPFDLGCMFIDELSIDNSNNLLFADKFISCLEKLYENSDQVKVNRSLTICPDQSGRKILSYSFKDLHIVNKAICEVIFNPNLACYILANGVGVFILYDCAGDCLSDEREALEKCQMPLIANYQKKLGQAMILNRIPPAGKYKKYIDFMREFKTICYLIILSPHQAEWLFFPCRAMPCTAAPRQLLKALLKPIAGSWTKTSISR